MYHTNVSKDEDGKGDSPRLLRSPICLSYNTSNK